jgi:hypothetical protein
LYVAESGGALAGSSDRVNLPSFIENTMEAIEDYARREPWTFAAWVFGVGFVLGWKLKPW